MNPLFPARCLGRFPVSFEEDLDENQGALKNPEKIGEEVTDVAAKAILQ